VLRGDDSVGEFHSVAVSNNRQQADTGTKMIHIGRNTRSRSSPRASAPGTARTPTAAWCGGPRAAGARNHTQCDSLLIGPHCGAHTFPYIEVKRPDATVEHEATTSKIGDDQLFYCRAARHRPEDAVSMIVNGFCKQVFKELPMEFAVEASWSAAMQTATCARSRGPRSTIRPRLPPAPQVTSAPRVVRTLPPCLATAAS
jgi:Fe-S cluster assembly protein SufB